MRYRHLIIALSLLAVLTGCRNNESVKADEKDSNGKQSTSTSVSQDGVLESLKNDAYLYSGLGQVQKLTYQGKLSPFTTGDFGEQTVSWAKNEDGSSIFTIKRNGILEGLGTETVRLDEKGVYLIGTSAGSLVEDAWILPSTFKVGTEWETDLILDMPGKLTTLKTTSKVVRKETITVPAGEFECLVVESDIVMTTDEPDTGVGNLKGVSYYAANYGEVRMEVTGENHLGDNVDIFIALVKIGD